MIHEFLDFRLDVERMELWCGAEKRAVEPQVFSLLVYLIENRDRVVGKDELFDAVWEGRIVSDATLNTRINAARKALGDSGKEQAVIRTIPRRGFRFVAETADSGAPSAEARKQSPKQTVRFCTTADGVQIAYAISRPPARPTRGQVHGICLPSVTTFTSESTFLKTSSSRTPWMLISFNSADV